MINKMGRLVQYATFRRKSQQPLDSSSGDGYYVEQSTHLSSYPDSIRMKTLFVLATIAFAVLFSCRTTAQEMVKEPSTEKSFPAEIKITYGGQDHALKLTGLTVRKKFIIKVYAVAHYMEGSLPAGMKEALQEVLTDGKAKQLTMDFSRDVTVEQIQGAYRDGFKENATAEELKAIQPVIDKFLAYFTREVKENDQFILRWLPGGVIIPIIAGEEKPPLVDKTFARVLWSIWFGDDSIVDRDKLIKR